MDDLADIRENLNAGEENALIQAGFHEEGIKKIEALVDRSHTRHGTGQSRHGQSH